MAERERHTLKRLLLTPLSGTGYFLGVVLAHLVIASGQTVIVYAIAYAFGGRSDRSLWTMSLSRSSALIPKFTDNDPS